MSKSKVATQKILLTKDGFLDLKKEYKDLNENQRPKIVEEIQSARSMGDLSENAMYHSAREKFSFIQGRLQEIEEILKRAKIVDKGHSKTVDIGKTVVLCVKDQKLTYSIVGPEEVSSTENKISHESPLGKSLIGKKVGDVVEFDAPSGKQQYEIVEVS